MPRPKNTTESNQSYDIPMRDGVRRAICLYFPEGKVPTSPIPTMLIQTRYGRKWVDNEGEREGSYELFRQSGFVVAVVDDRGSTAPFGSRAVERIHHYRSP